MVTSLLSAVSTIPLELNKLLKNGLTMVQFFSKLFNRAILYENIFNISFTKKVLLPLQRQKLRGNYVLYWNITLRVTAVMLNTLVKGNEIIIYEPLNRLLSIIDVSPWENCKKIMTVSNNPMVLCICIVDFLFQAGLRFQSLQSIPKSIN